MSESAELKQEMELLKGKLAKAQEETEMMKSQVKLEREKGEYEVGKIKDIADQLVIERQKLLDKEAVRAEVVKENKA